MNRDWHNKPLQGGGRDGWGYGQTDLTPDEPGDRVVVALAVLAFMALGGLLYWVMSGGRA